MDGFVTLLKKLLLDKGLPDAAVICKRHVELPGFFRPEKQWDVLVILDGRLLATIEFKSQAAPSFGNNFNNRSEEAIGSATDFRVAYREGAFKPSASPWLGYLMLLEDAPGSRKPVSVKEPHFPTFEEFRNSSYALRYELLLTKLVRERLYDSACLLLTDSRGGPKGDFLEPSEELSFENFSTSLLARVIAHREARNRR